MKHTDYVAAQRRKYRGFDRGFDEAVRRRKLATLFYVARRGMGLAREDVALRGAVDARVVVAIEQAKTATAEAVSAVAFVLRDGLAGRATDWRELLPKDSVSPSASVDAARWSRRVTSRRATPRLAPSLLAAA